MGELKQEEWARWRGLLSEQQTSGQTIAGFCRERMLPVWQFYEWRKRLGAKTEPFVAVQVIPSEPASLPIPPPPLSRDPIEIRLRSGRSLLVGPSFDAGHLCRLLRLLEQEP
jgi:hypothetical protein